MVEKKTVVRNTRRSRQGYVVSVKMNKTIVIEVEDRKKHPLYSKVVKKYIKFMAHDEEGKAGMGDLVSIVETRPISKNKHFRLLEIVEKAK